MLHTGKSYDKGHLFHTDGSSVTINICLGDEFKGGDLLLSTERCNIDPNKIYKCQKAYPDLTTENYKQISTNRALEIIENEQVINGERQQSVIDENLMKIAKRNYFRYVQTPYQAVIHRGEQPHLSTSTVSGNRMNLVLFLDTHFKFEHFENLSKDLKIYLLSFLDEHSISNFRLASKSSKTLAESDSLWKLKYEKKYGLIAVKQPQGYFPQQKQVPFSNQPQFPYTKPQEQPFPVLQNQPPVHQPPNMAFPFFLDHHMMGSLGTVEVDKQSTLKKGDSESYRIRFMQKRMQSLRASVFVKIIFLSRFSIIKNNFFFKNSQVQSQ